MELISMTPKSVPGQIEVPLSGNCDFYCNTACLVVCVAIPYTAAVAQLSAYLGAWQK